MNTLPDKCNLGVEPKFTKTRLLFSAELTYTIILVFQIARCYLYLQIIGTWKKLDNTGSLVCWN